MVWNSWEPSHANKEPAPQFPGRTGVVGVRGTGPGLSHGSLHSTLTPHEGRLWLKRCTVKESTR